MAHRFKVSPEERAIAEEAVAKLNAANADQDTIWEWEARAETELPHGRSVGVWLWKLPRADYRSAFGKDPA